MSGIKKVAFLAAIGASVLFGTNVLAANQQVQIVDFAFNPSTVQINVGDTVTWTNNGQVAHTVTSDNGTEMNSGNINPGGTYSHTFNGAGTYAYHCSIHPGMTGSVVVASTQNYIQTNPATNITDTQATLNGTVSSLVNNSGAYFQWGTSTNYGNQTPNQIISSGSYSQNITGLIPNTTYHYRAVGQTAGGTNYGSDMVFTTTTAGTPGGTNTGTGALIVNKEVINLTAGGTNWMPSVTAKAGDILSFAITLQAGNQDIHNVVVKDILPSNLIYRGNLTLNTNSETGDIASGINVGTVSANQGAIVAFQVQVGPGSSTYGTNSISNTATVTSTEGGTQTAAATININQSEIPGPTNVETGLTNNILVDSFLLPLILLGLFSWLYFSGKIYHLADWVKSKTR